MIYDSLSFESYNECFVIFSRNLSQTFHDFLDFMKKIYYVLYLQRLLFQNYHNASMHYDNFEYNLEYNIKKYFLG